MKTLHLLRHAKSSWDNPGLADHERGLNKRGRRDAPRMGHALAARMPAMVVCASTARRATLTLEGLCEAWPALAALPHGTDDDLYTFSADDLIQWIRRRDESLTSVFIIGHNPALTELINMLTAGHTLDNLPTAGYAQLLLDVPGWSGLRPGCGQLVDLLLPRTLENS